MLKRKIRSLILYLTIFALGANAILLYKRHKLYELTSSPYIKWVDFNITSNALDDALKAELQFRTTDKEITMIQLLSVLGAKYGGDFSLYKRADIDSIIERLNNGDTINDIGSKYNHFTYFLEAYTAVLNGFVGEYYINGKKEFGLRAFSPIASGFYFSHSDDFGVGRTYGYKRKHLGHDLMGSVGTPIIAVESGYVEAIGWNQYGGWRIGIRSFDNKRYYYYAHLRRDHPYASDFQIGDTVVAGDVIGYMGMTGYSSKENVNNINIPHLHFGIQLIFDPSQKDGYNQIWIDCYEIVKFLNKNKMSVMKTPDGKEYIKSKDFQIYDIPD